MEEKKEDRRSRYTRQTIKEIFMSLLSAKPYSKISISELCKQAEINRGTFYLHYLDLMDVLNEIIDDFFEETEEIPGHVLCPAKDACTYPFFEKLQNKAFYRPLFTDSTTSERFMLRFTEHEKHDFVTALMEHNNLTYEQSEAIFYFQMNGCLAVNRMLLDNPDADRHAILEAVDQVIHSGLEVFTGSKGGCRHKHGHSQSHS